jgi:hypothetical protein
MASPHKRASVDGNDENALSPFELCERNEEMYDVQHGNAAAENSVSRLLSMASSLASWVGTPTRSHSNSWTVSEAYPMNESPCFYDVTGKISYQKRGRYLLHLKDRGTTPLSLLQDISSIFRGRVQVICVSDSAGLSGSILRDIEKHVAEERTGLIVTRFAAGKLRTIAYQGQATFDELASFLAVYSYNGIPAEYLSEAAFLRPLSAANALSFLDGFPTEAQLQLEELARSARAEGDSEEEEELPGGRGEERCAVLFTLMPQAPRWLVELARMFRGACRLGVVRDRLWRARAHTSTHTTYAHMHVRAHTTPPPRMNVLECLECAEGLGRPSHGPRELGVHSRLAKAA